MTLFPIGQKNQKIACFLEDVKSIISHLTALKVKSIKNMIGFLCSISCLGSLLSKSFRDLLEVAQRSLINEKRRENEKDINANQNHLSRECS